MMAGKRDTFDPIGMLQALDDRRVKYLVVGALGRIIHGSGEVTDGIDIVPALTEANVRQLDQALDDLKARRGDRAPLDLGRSLASEPALELVTPAGRLKIVPEPAGTRGYDDLRRDASREPLGRGVRPQVASIADHARMLSALDREQDHEILHRVRRMVELDRGRTRSRGWTLER
jgi:hypothetical protein